MSDELAESIVYGLTSLLNFAKNHYNSIFNIQQGSTFVPSRNPSTMVYSRPLGKLQRNDAWLDISVCAEYTVVLTDSASDASIT